MLPSPLGSWRSRLAAFSVLVGTASLAKMDRSVTVLIYVDTSKQVVDPDHIEIFAGTDAAETWLEENDPEALPSRWFWNRQRRPTASRGQLAGWGLEGPSSREPHLDSYRDRPFLIERPGNRPGQIEVILRAETQPAKRMRISVSVQKCTHLGPYKYGHGSRFWLCTVRWIRHGEGADRNKRKKLQLKHWLQWIPCPTVQLSRL